MRVCCRVRPQNRKELQMEGAKRSVAVVDDVLEVRVSDVEKRENEREKP